MEDHRLAHALNHCKSIEKIGAFRKGFIYLITCRDFVKVGIAMKPASRLMELQVGCPYELRLLAAFPSSQCLRDEQRFHKMWKRYEVRGEWFQVPFGEVVGVASAESLDEVFASA